MPPKRLLILTLCIEEAAQKRDWREMQALLDQRAKTVAEMRSENLVISRQEQEQIEEINDRTWKMLLGHRRSILTRLQKLTNGGKVKKAYALAK